MKKERLIILVLTLTLIAIIDTAFANYLITSQPTGIYTVAWTIAIVGNPVVPATITKYSNITLTATITGGTPSGSVTFQKSVNNSGLWTNIGTAPVGTPTFNYNVTEMEGSTLLFRATYEVVS